MQWYYETFYTQEMKIIGFNEETRKKIPLAIHGEDQE